MPTFHEPLELRYWLINTLSGSTEIFVFLAFIVIAGMAAKFRMNGFVTLVMFGLFSILLSSYMEGIYMLICLLAGLVTFTAISRIVKK